MAERRAPAPPKGWDKKRAENRSAARAEPADQPARDEKPTGGTYLVVGPRSVFGAAPGETIRLCLTPSQEGHLIQAGHIARAEVGRQPVSEKE